MVWMDKAHASATMPKEYQAEWIGETGGNIHDVFYVSGGNTRRQNAPGTKATFITISNAQENITYRINTLENVYTEEPYHPDFIDDSRIQYARSKEKDGTARLELIGTETVDSQVCDVYRETSLTSYPYQDTYWVSRSYGVPIKIVFKAKDLSTNKMVEKKQEWFIRPGAQSAELFNLPPGIKRKADIAFASVSNTGIYSNKLIGKPNDIHTALCEDQQLHKIKYVNRHLVDPECNIGECRHDENYDRFEFVDTPLKEGMCLIGDDGYFRGKKVLQINENIFPQDSSQRPVCDQDEVSVMERSMGLPVKGCWRLGRFGESGTYNIAEFVEQHGVRSAALGLYDGRRLVLKKWSVKVPTEAAPDVWRLGDNGVFHPDERFVIFGLKDGSEMEIATVGYGGEGINYYLNRTNGNEFNELMHEYVYTAGY